MTGFIDAFLSRDGKVRVAIWQNIDDPDETPERRTMTVAAFRAEFPEEKIGGLDS